MSTREQQFGKKSENLAASHLRKHGYEIIRQNYRTKFGEIDIIAKDSDTIVFIEVKARNSGGYSPKAAITKNKMRKISMVALYYLKTTGELKKKARFDVVAIGPGKAPDNIEIVKNAFELAYR